MKITFLLLLSLAPLTSEGMVSPPEEEEGSSQTTRQLSAYDIILSNARLSKGYKVERKLRKLQTRPREGKNLQAAPPVSQSPTSSPMMSDPAVPGSPFSPMITESPALSASLRHALEEAKTISALQEEIAALRLELEEKNRQLQDALCKEKRPVLSLAPSEHSPFGARKCSLPNVLEPGILPGGPSQARLGRRLSTPALGQISPANEQELS